MSEGLTNVEFAERAGCHEKQVRRAIQKGLLHKGPDGLLDAAQLDTPWRRQNRRTTARASDNSQNVRASVRRVVRPKAEVSEAPAASPLDLDQADAFIRKVLAGEYASQAEADRIKANALALKHVIAAREQAGNSVSLADAERAMFEAGRAQRDAWLNWPSRVGPLIAAELEIEVDRLTPVLSEHVHQHLADLGEPEGTTALCVGEPPSATVNTSRSDRFRRRRQAVLCEVAASPTLSRGG